MFRSRSDFPFDKLLKGAVAGFIGTGPMTASMIIGWRLLPVQEKYPLPPRQITGEVAERLGIEDRMSELELATATLISHFGYGALTGSVYALLDEVIPTQPSVKGILAGLAVWMGSYLGWIPAVGILPPATRHPWRRNLLMIIAHIAWGATMGMVFKKLNSKKKYLKL
jgi:uncharacterized membrane protein YagU involved in acid resistance